MEKARNRHNYILLSLKIKIITVLTSLDRCVVLCPLDLFHTRRRHLNLDPRDTTDKVLKWNSSLCYKSYRQGGKFSSIASWKAAK